MFSRVVRAAIALTSTAFIVPYAIAFITELLYGRSTRSYNRYVKALHPHRVYALNLALLSTITKIRYAKLFYRWTRNYQMLSCDRVIKDVGYGQNQNCLDIYKPLRLKGTLDDYRLKPVVVFIYGGSWSSGDKKMYSLLCTQIADNFNCLVVCPNYSIYPKGFVDDMVQDISEVLQWVESNAILHNGDKTRVAIIGHSAGAHLASLTLMELCLKYLNTSPSSLEQEKPKDKEQDGLPLQVSFLEESTFVWESVVGGRRTLETAHTSLSVPNVEAEGDGRTTEWTSLGEIVNGSRSVEGNAADESGTESFVVIETNEENRCDDDSISPGGAASSGQTCSSLPQPPQVTKKMDKEHNLLKSIKLMIGLAGVYDVKKHYEHEATRAVENYSAMSRAMYDDENIFDNFSPAQILSDIPSKVRLPMFYLIHGSEDRVVPSSSTLNFAEAMWKRDPSSVRTSILVGCNHTDICIDLMDEKRRWYGAVMNEIKKAFKKCLM